MVKINYVDVLNKAFLQGVREILLTVAKEGLHKKQHLLITFATTHKGVKLSNALLEEYDDEITIVLQHEFWDLKVENDGFSVSLSFDTGDETIYVPFSALINVSDPSEDFSLNFIPDFSDVPREKSVPEPSHDKSGKIISLDIFRKNK